MAASDTGLNPQTPKRPGLRAMQIAAAAWYVPVLIGQFIFAAYIVYAYGGPVLAGDLTGWNEHISQAWVPKRSMGNGAVALHLILGIVIHVGGPLQLVPAIRKRFPKFHRWNGRVFVGGVIIAVATGVYMLLVREIGSFAVRFGFSLQAILILWFTFFALRHARRRQFAIHMVWATRLFLAASAVWFYRVIIMIWFVTTGGIGIDTSNATGWFLDVMSVGQFLPLLVYEIYARLKTQGGTTARYSMAVLLWIAAALTTLGVGVATLGAWFPILG